MSSFLSDKNINHLQYRLRQIFPENKWTAIQFSVRDSALTWFKQHADQLEFVYQRDGIEGLNKKFISDMVASAEYFEHSEAPVYQQDQLFDADISDPNIVADQPMPYVTGIENPMFTFSTFERGYSADGQPETKYVYREKPSFGANNALAYTMQGPGQRSGKIKHYSDRDGKLPKVTNRDAFNIADRYVGVRASGATPKSAIHNAESYVNAQVVQGFNPGAPSCRYCPKQQPQPQPRLVNYPVNPTSPYSAPIPTYAQNYNQNYNQNQNFLSKLANKLKGNKYPFRTKEDDSMVISGNYGENMKRNIYNSDQSKFFPNAYDGYKLGKFVEERSYDDGDYVPYPNNVTTKISKTLNQLSFGDVPVVMEMSNDEIAELGSQLYRNKDRVKRQRAPNQDGRCIPRQEYIELFDDYPTNEVRAKFHLDQIYNTPESRINTILDPVMGKSNMWMSQERSVLEIPCAGMSRVPEAKASDRYTNTRVYGDGYADSYAVPGCNSFNSEPRRNAYPNRDFIPARYTTTYGRY